MFRLYNFGIYNKLDWLVLNGKLNVENIFVTPWNKDGIEASNYLLSRWGKVVLPVDDKVFQYNKSVLNKEKILEYRKDYKNCVFCCFVMRRTMIYVHI